MLTFCPLSGMLTMRMHKPSGDHGPACFQMPLLPWQQPPVACFWKVHQQKLQGVPSEGLLLSQPMLLQVFALQPQYAVDLAGMGPALADNVHDVYETCHRAAESLKASPSQAASLTALGGMDECMPDV